MEDVVVGVLDSLGAAAAVAAGAWADEGVDAVALDGSDAGGTGSVRDATALGGVLGVAGGVAVVVVVVALEGEDARAVGVAGGAPFEIRLWGSPDAATCEGGGTSFGGGLAARVGAGGELGVGTGAAAG